MEDIWRKPWVIEWTQYLLDSYAHWLKRELIPRQGATLEQAERLFTCPFVVVSHGLQDDPILNYGNRTALTLWEMDWDQLTETPSRQTALSIVRNVPVCWTRPDLRATLPIIVESGSPDLEDGF